MVVKNFWEHYRDREDSKRLEIQHFIPVCNSKGESQDCGNYRGIKRTLHIVKIWERVIEKSLRGNVQISEQEFGFMAGRSTTDACFAQRQHVTGYKDRVYGTIRSCEKHSRKVKHKRYIKDIHHGFKVKMRCAARKKDDIKLRYD